MIDMSGIKCKDCDREMSMARQDCVMPCLRALSELRESSEGHSRYVGSSRSKKVPLLHIGGHARPAIPENHRTFFPARFTVPFSHRPPQYLAGCPCPG